MRETFAGACFLIANLLVTASVAAEIKCGDAGDVDTCDTSKCPVLVSKDSAGNWKVSPYNLLVTKQNAKLMFLMLQGGGKFVADPSKNNGVETKTNGAGQFDPNEQYPTDQFTGNPPKKAEGPIWHAKFKNQGGQRQNIKYWLRFQDGDTTITCDPLINNSGPITGSAKSKRK